MSTKSQSTRYIDPTIIPAQQGYRVAYLLTDGITSDTKPEDLNVIYDDVIAWALHPQIKSGREFEELDSVGVYPVTTDGLPADQAWHLVSPKGEWSLQYDRTFVSENEAKESFIKYERQKKSDRQK